jgi:hypothetical protein
MTMPIEEGGREIDAAPDGKLVRDLLAGPCIGLANTQPSIPTELV